MSINGIGGNYNFANKRVFNLQKFNPDGKNSEAKESNKKLNFVFVPRIDRIADELTPIKPEEKDA